MEKIISFLYSLDLGWLGMVALVICLICLAVAAFYSLAMVFLKSEEEIINDWRKEAGCGD